MQVSEAIFKYGRAIGVKVVPVYGGQPIFRQLQALDRGVHVVVGTPGRVLDHLGRGSLRLGRGAHGGARRGRRDARHGLRRRHRVDPRTRLPDERQTLLFSATMPPRITGIAKRYLRDPVRINDRPHRVERPSRRS